MGSLVDLAQLRKELVKEDRPIGEAEPIDSQQQSDEREWKDLHNYSAQHTA